MFKLNKTSVKYRCTLISLFPSSIFLHLPWCGPPSLHINQVWKPTQLITYDRWNCSIRAKKHLSSYSLLKFILNNTIEAFLRNLFSTSWLRPGNPTEQTYEVSNVTAVNPWKIYVVFDFSFVGVHGWIPSFLRRNSYEYQESGIDGVTLLFSFVHTVHFSTSWWRKNNNYLFVLDAKYSGVKRLICSVFIPTENRLSKEKPRVK